MQTRLLSSLVDLLLTIPRFIVCNVVFDGFIKQLGLLRDCAKVPTQAVDVVVANMHIINDYLP
jgi:hypothetical protein